MKLIVLLFVFYFANAIPVRRDNNNGRQNVMEHTGTTIGDSKIFQGDMLMKESVHDYYFGDSGKQTRLASAVRNTDLHWSLPIPYEFDNTIEESRKTAINAGFAEYAKKTCIKFRLKTSSDTDYISFTKANGCWSYVGKNGGKQQVSIGDGCEHLSTVAHEIMHALGFFHEQSRPDRDDYIEVKYENIKAGAEGNFEKQNNKTVTTLDHPYDYKSTMHYDRLAFSKNGNPTIIRRNGENGEDFGLGYQNEIGLSEIDVGQLRAMYCKGKPGTTTVSTNSPSGTAATSTHGNGGTTSTSTEGSTGTTATSSEGSSATTSTSTEGSGGTTSTSTEGSGGTASSSSNGSSATASTSSYGSDGTASNSSYGSDGTALTSSFGSSGTASTSFYGSDGTSSIFSYGSGGTSSTSSYGSSGTSSTSSYGSSGTSSTSSYGSSGTASTSTNGSGGTTSNSTSLTWTDSSSGSTAPTPTIGSTKSADSNNNEINYANDERKIENDIAVIENLMKDIEKVIKRTK